METPQDQSTQADPDPSPTGEGGKIQRIARLLQSLIEDMREWIDLRLDLALLEVEEQVEDVRNELALTAVLIVTGLFAGLFVLTTIALGVGWALGRAFWGFLIVSALLVLVVTLTATVRPDLMPPIRLYERVRERNGSEPPEESVQEEEPE